MIKNKLKVIIHRNTSIDLKDLETIKSRKREFVETRGIYYKILKDYTKFSLVHIGKDMGKSHATVLHAIRNFDYWVKYDKTLEQRYKKILKEFKEYVGIDKLEGNLTYNIEELMDNYVKLKKQYEKLKEKISENV